MTDSHALMVYAVTSMTVTNVGIYPEAYRLPAYALSLAAEPSIGHSVP